MSRKEQLSVLDSILSAQEGNLEWFPSYADALAEIQRGHKASCWMWYIWPSLRGARKTRFPSMLLSDLGEARDYLRHDVLGPRMAEITTVATKKLVEDGVPKWLLFGKEVDSLKFHEACTLFAVAAVANEDEAGAMVFAEALEPYGGSSETILRVLLDNAKNEGDAGSDTQAHIARVEEMLSPMPAASNRKGKAGRMSTSIKKQARNLSGLYPFARTPKRLKRPKAAK